MCQTSYMANPRLIHTAQALVDDVIEVPALPRRGRNAVATGRTRQAGGAVTVLVAAARCGTACVHAGSVGRGPNGDLIRAALAAEGITVSSPIVEDVDSGVCIVFVEPTAERTFVTVQGAERRISVASLDSAKPKVGDYVAVSGYTLQGPTAAPLLEWLTRLPRGVEIVLDPGAAFAELDETTRRAALDLTTIWTSNAEEAESLTGDPDMATAAPLVLAQLPAGRLSIVRDGPAGCTVSEGGTTTVVPGFPQKPLDTNGAGDTHTGVVLAELIGGLDAVTAARRANVAGALKVTRRGLPTRAEIDDFLRLGHRA